jgi:hypothetical protein
MFVERLTHFIAFITFALFLSFEATASGTFPERGIRDVRPGITAYTNATLVIKPGTIISNGTLLVENDRIVAAGARVSIPENAVVHDLNGAWIYPSFIELNSSYGLSKDEPRDVQSPQYEPLRTGAFAQNDAIKADYKAHAHFRHRSNDAEKLRKMGFGTVLSHRPDGIARGTGTWADIGAGDGTFTRALVKVLGREATIYAVDRDEGALASLRRWAARGL